MGEHGLTDFELRIEKFRDAIREGVEGLYSLNFHTDELTKAIIDIHKEVSLARGLDVPVASYEYVAKKMLQPSTLLFICKVCNGKFSRDSADAKKNPPTICMSCEDSRT